MGFAYNESKKMFPAIKGIVWTTINRPMADKLLQHEYREMVLKTVRVSVWFKASVLFILFFFKRSWTSKHNFLSYFLSQSRVNFYVSPDWMRGLSTEPRASVVQELLQTLLATRGSLVRVLTPTEAVHTLEGIKDMSAFVPEGRLIVDWEPFRPLLSNYQYITKYATVVASFDAHNPKLVTSFSFGPTISVKMGARLCIDFYCRETQNFQIFLLTSLNTSLFCRRKNWAIKQMSTFFFPTTCPWMKSGNFGSQVTCGPTSHNSQLHKQWASGGRGRARRLDRSSMQLVTTCQDLLIWNHLANSQLYNELLIITISLLYGNQMTFYRFKRAATQHKFAA